MIKLNKETKDKLIKAAQNVRLNAYAPYSHFLVGAALLLDDGSIEVGCNVENASYGLAICAERVAVSSAVSKGKQKYQAIAVVAFGESPAAPCGACRQFLAEFNGDLTVILATPEGKEHITSIAELLPLQFSKDALV